VIAGASCRAAAVSAAGAGWTVFAADCFDDIDLGGVASATRRASRYPEGLVAAVGDFPAAPWCYTGGLENHPAVIERISAARPLAGCPPRTVRLVRDPVTLAGFAREAGLLFPETHASPAGLPADGTFLRKPRASAGGRGIAPWTGTDRPLTAADWVWQRRLAGSALAAVLSLAADGPRLLGVSRQLVGEPWCHAPAFGFCGAIRMPWDDLPAPDVARLERFGSILAAAGLRGVVGVDLVRVDAGGLAVIEVNPRPPASAELVERASGESILATHLASFGLRSPRRPPATGIDTHWSKAILFAPTAIVIDRPLVERLLARAAEWTADDGLPSMADLPRPGQTLRAGSPVLTVFARAASAAASLSRLRLRLSVVRSLVA